VPIGGPTPAGAEAELFGTVVAIIRAPAAGKAKPK
jgi:hypothetical protein